MPISGLLKLYVTVVYSSLQAQITFGVDFVTSVNCRSMSERQTIEYDT